MARCALLGAIVALGASTARAQDDDWSVTREEPTRPRRGERPPRRARPPRTGAASEDAGNLRERYLGIVLADPRDGFAMDRLLALYRDGDGSLAALTTALEAHATSHPDARTPVDLVRARVARESGDAASAAALYRAIAADTSASDAHVTVAELGLAALERASGDLRSARDHVTRASERAAPADRDELIRTIAELSLDSGDFDAAAAAYARLGRGARSVHLRSELPRALAARGEHARAIEAYRALAAEVAADRRAQVPLLVEMARSSLALGRTDEALATLEEARSRAGATAGVRGEIAELSLDAHRRAGSLAALAEQWARAPGAEERLAVAQALDELGRDADAAAAYRRAASARPRDAAPRLGEIRVLLRSGEIDAAIAGYRALLRVAPRPAHVIALAELLEAHGRRDEALEIADRLLRTARAGDVASIDALAGLFTRWNETERANLALRRRAELSPDDPVPVIALGDQLLAAGDTEGALRTFRRILTLGGDPGSAHATLGGVYLDHDRVTEAVTELETAVRLRTEAGTPVEVETLRLLAQARERGREEARTEEAWRAVLAAAGSDGELAREAREHVVGSWHRARTLDTRLAELRAAFTATPPDLEAGRFLVEALRRRRDLPAAITALRRLADLAPGELAALSLLERLEVQRGDLAGAIDALERLARAEPRRAAERYRRMAEHALDLYRDDDALRYARHAVELAPDAPEGWVQLAELERARGDAEAAAQALRRAVSLDARRYELVLALATLEAARGDRSAAETLWLTVIEGSGDDTLVTEAVRSILDGHDVADARAGDPLLPLESALLAQVLRAPDRVALRRAFIGLLHVQVAPLLARRGEPEAEAELSRIVTRGLAPLLLAIAGTDPGEASSAIELVRVARVRGAASALLVRAERGRDAASRLEALAALAALAGPEHAARLAELARSPSPAVGSGAPRTTEATPATTAPGTDVALRALATWTLGRALAADRPRLERMLAPLLADPEREVRAYAALALGGTTAAPLATESTRETARRALVPGTPDGPLMSWAFARTFPTEVAERATPTGASASSLSFVALARTETDGARRWLVGALLEPAWRGAARDALRSATALDAAETPRAGEPAASFLVRALGTRSVPPEALGDALESVLSAALSPAADETRARAALVLLVPGTFAGEPAVFVDGLISPDDPSSGRVLDAVLRHLEPSLDALARSGVADVRGRAIAVLAAGSRRDDPALYALALEDPSPSVARGALEARRGAACSPELEPVLARALLTHSDWAVRAAAAAALLGASGEASEQALIDAARSDAYSLVRDLAVRTLTERAGLRPATCHALEDIARDDPEPRVRASASDLSGCASR